jgi:glycosyltransferase involved in cell wall biosynthesis
MSKMDLNSDANFQNWQSRIAVDAKRYYYNKAGLGNYSRVLLHELFDILPSCQFQLLSPVRNQEPVVFKFPPKHVDKVILGKGVFAALQRVGRSAPLLKALESDFYLGLSNELPLDIRRSKVKSVLVVHDTLFLDYPQEYKRFDRLIYTHKLRQSLKNAHAVVAVSQYTADRIRHHFPFVQEEIHVISSPVDVSFWRTRDTFSFPQLIGLIPSTYLLAVGTWGERKNLKRILDAMDLLNWPVKLAVSGNALKSLPELASHPALIRLPYLSSSEMRSVYQQSLGLLYPSIDEGFGLPLVEAMAAQVPLLTSNRGALIETTDAQGVLVDPFSVQSIASGIRSILELNGASFYRQESIVKHDKHAVAIQFVALLRQLTTSASNQ